MDDHQDLSRRNFMKTAAAGAAASIPLALGAARGARAEENNGFNIAVLSAAHIHTEAFMGNLLHRDDAQSYLLWDDDADRGERFAENFDTNYVSDLDEAVEDPAIDGFIICAENTRHLPLLERAIPTGKPVFCEKPLVTTTEELAVVEGLLEEHGTPLFCGYFHPFGAEMQGAKALIDAGEFGDITRISYREAHHAAYGRWFDNPDVAWFTDPELAGGGALMDLGTHAVHLVLSFFGPVNRVWAEIRNETGIYPDVDDFGVAMLEFDSGVLGRVEAGWTQTGGVNGLEVVGSDLALWNTPDGYYVGAPGRPRDNLERGSSVVNRVDRLLAILRDEIPEDELEADLQATKDAVRVMEAAYQSAESGAWVEIA